MRTIGSGEAEITEAALLDGAIGFSELAQSARPALVRAAYAVTGRREDAEDAVQASLLKAMGAWPRVAGQERWRQQAYVRQIVVNTCRSSWRKWGSRVSVGEMPELAQPEKTDVVDDTELVRQALAQLPTRQRQVLLLRYYEDLSEVEIARRLGCAPGTVKSSAARALRALRDLLPDYASNPVPGDAVTGTSLIPPGCEAEPPGQPATAVEVLMSGAHRGAGADGEDEALRSA